MSASAAVHTSESRVRANRPSSFGMHPEMARRLREIGVDPEQRAQEIRASRGSEARGVSTIALARSLRTPAKGEAFSLDPSDVMVTELLNQAGLRYRNDAFIADAVVPVQLVGERSAKYKIWGRNDALQAPDDAIGPNGSAKEVEPTLSEDNYSVQDRALKGFTSYDTEMANPALGIRARTVEMVREQQMLLREIRANALLMTAANYASTNKRTLTAGGAGTNWGGSAADPVDDMLDMIAAITGVNVTDAVMSDTVWNQARKNTALKAMVASQLSNEGLLRAIDFQTYFGIPNLWISKAVKLNSSSVRVRVWSETNLWLGYVDRRPDAITFARTFRLRQGAGGFVTKTWQDPDRGVNGGEWTRVSFSDDEKIVAATYGAVVENVIG